MTTIHRRETVPQQRIVMVGFGSIGKAVIQLIFQHLHYSPSQITILSKDEDGIQIAKRFGVTVQIETVTQENYVNLIGDRLQAGDFLLNLSVNISSLDLIGLCQEKGALYLDTCTEPWEGVYVDKSLSPALRTNYALREAVLNIKKHKGPTAVLTHGANPGLVSHFVKHALWNMANDSNLTVQHPELSADWASLANTLAIKSIQIAEHDTQITNKAKSPGEFVNTWSVDGFVAEGAQPAELGWGTHERHWPHDGHHHESGPKCSIYLDRPGAGTQVRTWTPSIGPAHGFLITHAESISIAHYLTLKHEDEVIYRPTVHYAYVPCPDAILSLHELASNEWHQQKNKRIIFDEIVDGTDELGVLLMGNKKGAYWYGSQLSITEARKHVPYNNATSLQVAIGVIAGMSWAIDHPNSGMVEPEDIDHQYIMDIATPYLGKVAGYYTDWNPLQKRQKLFQETLDHTDPWQFLNIRVGGN